MSKFLSLSFVIIRVLLSKSLKKEYFAQNKGNLGIIDKIYFGVGSSAPNIASMPGMPDFKSFFRAFFASELPLPPPLLAC